MLAFFSALEDMTGILRTSVSWRGMMDIFCWNLNCKFTHGITNMTNQFCLYTKMNSKVIFGSNVFLSLCFVFQEVQKADLEMHNKF